jgi:hypothetical protein
MLKTVSFIGLTGQLVYAGTWNANTNSPTLTSGVGTKNTYYVVSVAGTTTLDGISSWSVGDWAIFNGTVWEKVLGGTTESFANLTVTGTATLTNMVSGNVTITGGTINVTATNHAATVASTATYGTASLPLQPLGFMEVDLNGTVVKVPYYAV